MQQAACTAWPHICIVAELAPQGSLHALLHPPGQASRPLPYTQASWAPVMWLHVACMWPAWGCRHAAGANSAGPELQVIQLGMDIASAMCYLASVGVIHRDLKPQNVLLSNDVSNNLRAKVADFGIARCACRQHTQLHQLPDAAAVLSSSCLAGMQTAPAQPPRQAWQAPRATW